MSYALIFLDICRILFFIGYGIIIVFLIKQLGEVEDVARPFLISLILFFLLELIGSFLVWLFNKLTDFGTTVETTDPIYFMNAIGYLLILYAPVYLIFILERHLFQKSIIKEKHLITILELTITIVIFVIGIGAYILQEPMPFIFVFVFLFGMIALQSFFFLAGFIYLTINSTGEYRKNSSLVVLGYSLRIGASGYAALISFQVMQGLWKESMNTAYLLYALVALVIFIGMIVMAYALLKLYRKRELP